MYHIIRAGTRLRYLPAFKDCCDFRSLQHPCVSPRFIHRSQVYFEEESEKEREKKERDEKEKNEMGSLPALHYFSVKKKNKETFTQAVEVFKQRDPRRRGHVEFILAALKYMEEFEVDHDLESYKTLLQVLPTGKFVPTNVFQSEFMHFPKQQNCAVSVLDHMERKNVMPDEELGKILLDTFGKTGIPVRKYMRMLYWMPKFLHANPWPVPRPTPKDAFTLAKLAIERITSVDIRSVVSVLDTKEVEDAIDNTWIVSGQSPKQQKLLDGLPENAAVFVEGPNLIWLRNLNVQYFTLRADPSGEPEPEPLDVDDVRNLDAPWSMDKKPKRIIPPKSVHEQEDGIVLSVCATGTSSKDSLLSWIRLLEKNDNPRLADLPVLFRLRSAPKGEIVAV